MLESLIQDKLMAAHSLKPIGGLLLDISGVLKDGDLPIEGSIEAIQKLQKLEVPFRLVTNETQYSKRLLHEHLCHMGFAIPSADYIVSPAPILAKYLKENGLNPHLLVHPNVIEDFDDTLKADPNCLVIGDAAEHFSYEAVNKAFQFLVKDKSVRFFSMGKGKYYKLDGSLWLDVGAYTTALEYATGAQAEVYGKPSISFFQHAIANLGMDPEKVAMIGDDVVGDVQGAQEAGMRGILVQTGKYREGDENRDDIIPDGVVKNLKDAVDLIFGN